jgi:hypothetical protein
LQDEAKAAKAAIGFPEKFIKFELAQLLLKSDQDGAFF